MNQQERDLLSAITQALAPLPPSLTNQSAGSDLYEAYILTVVVQAATTQGATVSYETVSGTAPTQFVFRTSPGHIYSTRHPYTHAVLEFANKAPLEVHVGVRVVGRSKVLHECDVAVIDQAEAELCRLNRVEPRSSKVLIASEGKFYSTSLVLGLGRSFVGLTVDLSAQWTCFVANTTSVSVARLLAADKRRHWYDDVIVGSPSTDLLQGFVATAFHHYKAHS